MESIIEILGILLVLIGVKIYSALREKHQQLTKNKDFLFTRKIYEQNHEQEAQIVNGIKKKDKDFNSLTFQGFARYSFLKKISEENNTMQKITINYTELNDYHINDDSDEIHLAINFNYLKNNKLENETATYIAIFKRYEKKKHYQLLSDSCPSCGAPTTFTTFGKCRYCGQYVSFIDTDWKLESLKEY